MRIVISLFCALLLSGCWDGKELNDRAYVNTLAIDKTKDSEYRVCISISDIAQQEGGGHEDDSKDRNKGTKEHRGSSVMEAINECERRTSRSLFFGHLQAVLFGKELLSDRDMFLEALAALEQNSEFSRKMMILAGEDIEICEMTPAGEPSLGAYAVSFYKKDRTGETFELTLEELLISISKTGSAVIPKIEEDEGEILLRGSYQF